MPKPIKAMLKGSLAGILNMAEPSIWSPTFDPHPSFREKHGSRVNFIRFGTRRACWMGRRPPVAVRNMSHVSGRWLRIFSDANSVAFPVN